MNQADGPFDDIQHPGNWRARLLLFAVYPLALLLLVPAMVLLLVIAWPACLFVHKLPNADEPPQHHPV